jgi:hypothetical protein
MADKEIETYNLLKRVQSTKSITRYLNDYKDFPDAPDFPEYLNQLRLEKNIRKERLFVESYISPVYGHEIFKGKKHPSRDKIIQLAFGLGLNVDETQKLLRIGNQAELYPKIKRDAVICHSIAHKMTIVQTNSVLTEHGFPMLGDNG